MPQQDQQTRDITPKTLGHIRTALEQVFVQISNISAQDPGLQNISQMRNCINKTIEAVNKPPQHSQHPQLQLHY